MPQTAPLRFAALATPTAGLALDGGGTACRWAMVTDFYTVLAQGELAPFDGGQLATVEGRTAIVASLQPLADTLGQALQRSPGNASLADVVVQLRAGITGLDMADAPQLAALLHQVLGLPLDRIEVSNDVELACRAQFEPGEGYLLYAGTGSIAGFVDAQGKWHRAGGRGVLLDDAGGGYWIARRALRQVWRAEDAAPGSWQRSPMARQLFEALGGSTWADTRRFMLAADRGRVGRLALAVAAAADHDMAARSILDAAGRELARLALALNQRFGPRPLGLAGRVWQLHPTVLDGLRRALPADALVHTLDVPVEVAAARRAAVWGGQR